MWKLPPQAWRAAGETTHCGILGAGGVQLSLSPAGICPVINWDGQDALHHLTVLESSWQPYLGWHVASGAPAWLEACISICCAVLQARKGDSSSLVEWAHWQPADGDLLCCRLDYVDINVAVFTGFDPEMREFGEDPEEALQAMCAMFSRLSDSQYQRAVINIDGAPSLLP